jgi:hypothetical protein
MAPAGSASYTRYKVSYDLALFMIMKCFVVVVKIEFNGKQQRKHVTLSNVCTVTFYHDIALRLKVNCE